MSFTSVPVLVILSYIAGEIFKVIFKNNKDLNKLIPVLVSLIGGGLGILIYFTSRELLKVNTIYEALMIGLVSGAASTGTNQIIKKIFGGNKDDIK